MIERLRWKDSISTQLAAQRQDFDLQLSQFAVLPSILATDPRLIAALANPTAETAAVANRFLAFTSETSLSAAVFLMDANGTTIAASNFEQGLSFVGKNYAFRPYFSDALQGGQTTFFAVGATTGIPGYFIANPVSDNRNIIGVVVVKIEPGDLPAVWSEGSEHAVVTDELGISILATDERFLYAQSRSLEADDLQLISDQRRYPIEPEQRIEQVENNRWNVFSSNGDIERFSVISTPLQKEPWQLHILQSNRKIRLDALKYLLGFLALLSIAALLLRIYQQQKQLSIAREEQARVLERQVQERTRDLETAQQALIAESNFAMLGRMSAAINHEINQPLASLRLNLATLRRIVQQQNNPDVDIQEIVIESDRTTKRIGRVIETLRSVSRQGLPRFEPVDFRTIVDDAVDTVKRERPIANEALSTFEPAKNGQTNRDDYLVPGNEILLQQAILNLLYNALDAVVANNSADPEVKLTVTSEADQIRLSVSDNGIGVSTEMEKRLFKPFAVDPDNSRGLSHGLGLGLTLAQQITEDHAGTLTYQRREGGGSSFTLSLPLA